MSITNGKMRTFLSPAMNLLRSIIQFFDNLFHPGIDFLIGEHFFGRIHEQNIHAFLNIEGMFLFSPAFSDASFEQIAFYGSLE